MSFDRLDLLSIAAGGVVGASLRWVITRPTPPRDGGWFVYLPNTEAAIANPGFPLSTLLVNVLGCLVLGAVLRLRTGALGSRRIWLGAGTGFCGSLTTFSTFAVEVAQRLSGPTGQTEGPGYTFYTFGPSHVSQGYAYIVSSIAAGAIAFVLGRRAAARWSS